MVCALDYKTGDPGSIPGSDGTTDWLFSAQELEIMSTNLKLT